MNIPEPENVDAGVTSVCISPDGRLVAAGSLDTVVRIWDVATGQLVERLRGHRDSVYSVAFTPDSAGLVSGSLDKTLKYWDVRPILRREPGAVSGPGGALTPAGKSGAGGAGGKEGAGEKGSQCTMNFTGHKDYVLSVAVSHDGKWVVSGSKDRGVQFWDANTAMAQCMLQGHKNSGTSPFSFYPSLPARVCHGAMCRVVALGGVGNQARGRLATHVGAIECRFGRAGWARGMGTWTGR